MDSSLIAAARARLAEHGAASPVMKELRAVLEALDALMSCPEGTIRIEATERGKSVVCMLRLSEYRSMRYPADVIHATLDNAYGALALPTATGEKL